MSTKAKKTSRGKRYSDQEKAEIIDFVNKINSEKGRGGQSAASKKFKISPLTISSWLKKSGAPKKAKKAPARKAAAKKRGARAAKAPASTSSAPIGRKLAKLQSLYNKIERAESDLNNMKAEFEALKGSL